MIKAWKLVGVLTVLALILSLGMVTVPMSGTVKAAPGDLYVDDDGECGHLTPCYKLIQDAINEAKEGSTIIVYPGTYNECLVIDGKKSLTIQSLEKGNASIDVQKLGCDAIQIGGVKEAVDGVVIDGFTICNASEEGNGICVIDGSDLDVTNNEIRDCGTGISLVLPHDGHVISNVLVESNHFEGNHNGIKWGSGSNIVIRNNTFINYNIGIYIKMMTEPLDVFQVTDNDLIGGKDTQGILWTHEKGGKGEGGTIPVIRYNNIYGNLEYGARNKAGGVMDATHNWWGHPSGPYHSPPLPCNPYGQGDAVSDGVNFEPWLLSEWVTTDTVHTKTDLLPKENKSVDIPGVVEAIAEIGNGIVTVGQYVENPGTEAFYSHVGEYVDVHITEVKMADSEKYDMEKLLINIFYDEGDLPEGTSESSLMMYWWNGSGWQPCSDAGVNTADDFIWAIITVDTQPGLSDLTGTPFACRRYQGGGVDGEGRSSVGVGGEVYRVNRMSVLAPWLSLALIVVIGGSILVMRRRTSRQE